MDDLESHVLRDEPHEHDGVEDEALDSSQELSGALSREEVPLKRSSTERTGHLEIDATETARVEADAEEKCANVV